MNTNQKTLGQIAINGYSACLSDEHEDRWEFAAQAVRQHVLATETDDGWRLLDVLRQHVDSMRCERNKLKEELATSKKCLVIANRSADDQMQQKREAQKERDSLRSQLTESQKRVEELEKELDLCKITAGNVMCALTKHFPSNPDWKLDDELLGIILQISNATAAWVDAPKSPWIPCSEMPNCAGVRLWYDRGAIVVSATKPELATHWMPIPPLPPKPQEDDGFEKFKKSDLWKTLDWSNASAETIAETAWQAALASMKGNAEASQRRGTIKKSLTVEEDGNE